MITAFGYSKDPNIIPEGIVITFGKDMILRNGGHRKFIKYFLTCINDEECYWMHKMTNKPTIDFTIVYIVIMNRLWGRVNFGWYENNKTFAYSVNDTREIEWPRMVITGPFKPCPYKRTLKGFQGFRYCTEMF
jgi:hypothetical protein